MSKLKVTAIHDPDNDNEALTIDSSGNVTASQGFVPSTQLSHRNLIINGDMQVAQRGTSGTLGSGNFPSVDRIKTWNDTDGGSQAFTGSQETDSPDDFKNSFKVQCTTANTGLGAAANLILRVALLEGQDCSQFAYGTSSAKNLTFSCWVKSNITGSQDVLFVNHDAQRHASSTIVINSADTWEKKEFTIAGDTSNGFTLDNSLSLSVDFFLSAGSNWTGGSSPGAWQTRDTSRAVNSLQLASSTSNYFQITGVQLEVGSVATPFEHRSYGEELQRCLRYFYKPTKETGAGALMQGYWYTATSCRGTMHLPVTMRTNPTVYHDDVTDVRLGYGGGSTAASGFNGIQGSSKNAVWMDYAAANNGIQESGGIMYMYPGNPGVAFSAEL